MGTKKECATQGAAKDIGSVRQFSSVRRLGRTQKSSQEDQNTVSRALAHSKHISDCRIGTRERIKGGARSAAADFPSQADAGVLASWEGQWLRNGDQRQKKEWFRVFSVVVEFRTMHGCSFFDLREFLESQDARSDSVSNPPAVRIHPCAHRFPRGRKLVLAGRSKGPDYRGYQGHFREGRNCQPWTGEMCYMIVEPRVPKTTAPGGEGRAWASSLMF